MKSEEKVQPSSETVDVAQEIVIRKESLAEEVEEAPVCFTFKKKKKEEKVETADYSIDSKTKSYDETSTEITIKKKKKAPSVSKEESSSGSIKIKLKEEEPTPQYESQDVSATIPIIPILRQDSVDIDMDTVNISFKKKSKETLPEEYCTLRMPKYSQEEIQQFESEFTYLKQNEPEYSEIEKSFTLPLPRKHSGLRGTNFEEAVSCMYTLPPKAQREMFYQEMEESALVKIKKPYEVSII
jgi:hypothetical protein